MGLPWSSLVPIIDGPLRLEPGETDILVNHRNQFKDRRFSIVSLGVTQHPNTTYTYVVDGRSFELVAPLGTFINPLYTCRDLGAYIDVDETFQVIVTNDDDQVHRYAGQHLFIERGAYLR